LRPFGTMVCGVLMTMSQDEYRHALASPGEYLESNEYPEVQPPRFDITLDAWILTRYSDISAAYKSSSLLLTGLGDKRPLKVPDEAEHEKMRAETLDALSPKNLERWSDLLALEVEALLDKLSREKRIDLIKQYGKPLCLFLAAIVTGLTIEEAQHLAPQAREVSESVAEPCDATRKIRAKAAKVVLRNHFSSGPEALRDSGFVALSQTLPCLLGNAWFALTRHKVQWELLHCEPTLGEQAIEELLRYAGLTRVLFRVASTDIDLNGLRIRKGTRLVLRIIAGNRDQLYIDNPNQLDIRRRGSGHLSLGMGHHACIGAGLIRMAMRQTTLPLVTRFEEVEVAEPVFWKGGSGFRSPQSLWVNLR